MPRTRDKIIAKARKIEPNDHLGRPLASLDQLIEAEAKASKKKNKKEEDNASGE